MSDRYLISFCIPTYNFGSFIRETLESIASQADSGDIEIVIVDGASTDNTVEIVNAFRCRFPHVTLLTRDVRCGVDRDILETVNLAKGRFCWLLSSDDVLAPNAIAEVRKAIANNAWDVLLPDIILCDLALRPLWRHSILRYSPKMVFDWAISSERTEYFSSAETTTAFFSFISNIIVRREYWNPTPFAIECIGTCWIIAATLLSVGKQGGRFATLNYDCILKRGENDSFLEHGTLKRLGISLREFRRIGELLFGSNSSEARNMRRTLRNEYPLMLLLIYKSIVNRTQPSDIEQFNELVRYHYNGDRWSDSAATFLVTRCPPRIAYLIGAFWVGVESYFRRLKFRLSQRSRAEEKQAS